MRDSISSGVSLCIVTFGFVVIAASIWDFGLGGPVFILATLLSLNENLTGARGVASTGAWFCLLRRVAPLWEEPSEALLELHGLPLSTPLAECPCYISAGCVLQASDRTHIHLLETPGPLPVWLGGQCLSWLQFGWLLTSWKLHQV